MRKALGVAYLKAFIEELSSFLLPVGVPANTLPSALAALEDRDNLATSPPSNPTSPMLTKSQVFEGRRSAAAGCDLVSIGEVGFDGGEVAKLSRSSPTGSKKEDNSSMNAFRYATPNAFLMRKTQC
jgi:hypothetical protein